MLDMRSNRVPPSRAAEPPKTEPTEAPPEPEALAPQPLAPPEPVAETAAVEPLLPV